MDVRGCEERGRCRQADEGRVLAEEDRQGVACLPFRLPRSARPLISCLSAKVGVESRRGRPLLPLGPSRPRVSRGPHAGISLIHARTVAGVRRS